MMKLQLFVSFSNFLLDKIQMVTLSSGYDDNSIAKPVYGDSGWISGLPWLYYNQTPSAVVQKSGRVSITVSFY
jgi:hypothetical protein